MYSARVRRHGVISQADRLEVITVLAERLSTAAGHQDLCCAVYEQLSNALPVDAFVVAQAGTLSGRLKGLFLVSDGREQSVDSVEFEPIQVGAMAGPALRAVAENPLFAQLVPASRGSTILCTMRAAERLVGHVGVMCEEPRAFSAADARFAGAAADMLAVALDSERGQRDSALRETDLRARLSQGSEHFDAQPVISALHELAAGLARVSGANAVIVSLLDAGGAVLTPTAKYADPGVKLVSQMEPFARDLVAPGEFVPGSARDVVDGNSDRWHRSKGWHATIVIDLLAGDARLGIVELASTDAGFVFTPRILDVCRIIVRQAAVGLHHAIESRRAIERSTSLSDLAEFSATMNNAPDELASALQLICDEASRLLKANHASLFLIHGAAQQLELQAQCGARGAFELGATIEIDYPYSLAARAVRDGHVLVHTEPGRRSRSASALVHVDVGKAPSAIALPLVHNGVALGAILLTDRRRRREFPAEELRLAAGMAQHAAAAVARSQVRTAAQERLRIASTLGRISAGIVSEEPAESIYALVLHEARSLLTFDEAAISVFDDSAIVVAASLGATFKRMPRNASAVRLWRDPGVLDLHACLRDASLAKLVATSGVTDVLSYPFNVNGIVMGRLTFASARSKRFDAHDGQLAVLLAERTAQVVATMRLRIDQQEAVRRLTELDDLRQDFIATISHEIRTPLTGILGYHELLLSRWQTLDDPRRRVMLERAQSAASRLEHLVNDLLLFSSVEYDGLKLHLGLYDLGTLVEQASEAMRSKYRSQNVEIRIKDVPARVFVDADRTVQVVANLIDNAIKYSHIGSAVDVRLTVHRTTVETVIRDKGPGILEEDVARLFTRFGTLGHQPRPGQVGTGIGLYVCRKLIEAMNGTIWVTSRPGRGSSFHFTLPRAARGDSAVLQMLRA